MAELPHGNAKMRATLARALAHVDVDPRDAGVVHIADRYAREIDDGGDFLKLGPGLLRVLQALGMTPDSRKTVTRPTAPAADTSVGGDPDAAAPVSAADQLAQRRARARERRASVVDASTP